MTKKRTKSLRYEITAAIALKLTLLFLLWFFCFSHPIKNQLTDEKMRAHFLSPTNTPFKDEANL